MIIWVIIGILVLIALFFLVTYYGDKYAKKSGGSVKEKTYKKLSGHSPKNATKAKLELIEEIDITEDPVEKLQNELILHDIELYNLQDREAALQREQQIALTIIENQDELYEHIDFALDIVPDMAPFLARHVAPRVIPVENRIVQHIDMQNVHDTGVNASVRGSLAKLQGLNINKDDATKDLQQFIDTIKYDTPEQKNKIEKVLFKIFTDTEARYGENLSEVEVLAMILAKSKGDPEKEASLVSSLEDCFENNETVCATGRVNRIVSSLSFLDKDVGVPIVTNEMLRNDCFSRSGAIVKEAMKERGPEFEEKYNTGVSDEETVKFVEETKQKIEDDIRGSYKHLEAAPGVKLNEIIANCKDGF